MNKNLLLAFLLVFPIISKGQIDCKPTLGFAFKPIEEGISLYKNPNLNSEILLKSPAPDKVWLKCSNPEIINDFVEVEVDFLYDAFTENGVNDYLFWLHHYLTDQYSYSFNFKTFMDFIQIKENQRKVYDLLINDEKNDWFKDYSSSDEYDVSTFEGFYKNWIYYDKAKSNDDYIINNQGRKVFVHKSKITNETGAGMILNGASSDYYLESFQKQLKLKGENSCIYDESTLIFQFEYYANALIEEGEPFKVIQEISNNKYEFEKFSSQIKLDFLKMKASYFDKNYSTSIKICNQLIQLFEQDKITNSNNSYDGGDMDMSRVYAYLVSGLLNMDRYQDALKSLEKCSLDRNLQFEQYEVFYGITLLNLDQKNKACKILNEAYLNGNQNARDLIKENCE